MDFHDELLAKNNGSWDAPPVEVHWSDASRHRRDEIIAGYPDNVAWGFKDPRTLLTLDGWLQAIPRLRLVGTFRHPVAVARSLAARNNFPLDFSIDLWLAYNERLLSFHERFQFQLISFDSSDQDYQGRVASMAKNLGLPDSDSRSGFFDNLLRHSFEDPQVRLPENVAAVYARLLERAK